MDKPTRSVDILIPVYSGSDETLRCIASVCDSLSICRARADVVVIFDAGPDLQLRETLLELAAQNKIKLLINETNQGFVRSINRGIRHSENDVVLLNSDTEVAGDWLDRLLRRAYASASVATVTPFSNNAEICSWPEICRDNPPYLGASTAAIDAVFSRLDAPAVQIPTAVGFCMFVKRSCINRIGILDADTFGRGYGEENDFCMRASALGFTHVLATNVFVFHQGGVSFGAEKQERVAAAMDKLDKLYPNYHARVAEHIRQDPARRWRFAAELLFRQRNEQPLILHISHGIGGGTDKHVVELARHCQQGCQHAMLVPQANCMRLVFPNVISGGLFEFSFHEMRELKDFVFSLSLARIHIHHVKGWENLIERVIKILDVPYDVTLHDYYFLHVNPALADPEGVFCEDVEQRDALSANAIAFPRGVTAADWRRRWYPLLNRAERIFAPSFAAASLYNSYHPDLEIHCASHPDSEVQGSYPDVVRSELANEEPLHLVVLGALSVIKGANVLERVSQLAAKKNKPLRFTLIGYAYKKLAHTVNVTGSYQDAELAELLREAGAHAVWFPCTWPETYSYTLSSALEAGLPVICPRLGSFPERVANRPATWIEDWQLSPEQWLDRLLQIREDFMLPELTQPWTAQPRSEFSYAKSYRHFTDGPVLDDVSAAKLMEHWLSQLPEVQTAKGRLYRSLIWLNSHRVFGHVANLIPLPMRRRIKRKLSTRPLHD